MSKELLGEFKKLLLEREIIPKDELRDNYLVPSRNFLNSFPHICHEVLDDETALSMVIKEITKAKHQPIREESLYDLAWTVCENITPCVLNYQNKNGNSAIHLACHIECFSVGLLDFMKDKGANFSIINKRGETPLFIVSSCNSLDDVKFIHAYTEKNLINHQDYVTGTTALMKALISKKINNVFFLLEQGADLFIQDHNGLCTIDIWKDKDFQRKFSLNMQQELEEVFSIFAEKQKIETNLKNHIIKSNSFIKSIE